jgi:hypothetical protein
MKYILLIYDDPKVWGSLSEAEQRQIMADYRQLSEDMKASGQYLAGSQLAPTAAATSVKVRNGKRLLTDGPFAETREQLGGYFLIEAKDLDEALAIAERVPSARLGTIEVRPLAGAPVPAPA